MFYNKSISFTPLDRSRTHLHLPSSEPPSTVSDTPGVKSEDVKEREADVLVSKGCVYSQ